MADVDPSTSPAFVEYGRKTESGRNATLALKRKLHLIVSVKAQPSYTRRRSIRNKDGSSPVMYMSIFKAVDTNAKTRASSYAYQVAC